MKQSRKNINRRDLFTLVAAVVFASPQALLAVNITGDTASTTGALTVAGGIGVGLDSFFNGVRIGRGNGMVVTNTAVGASSLQANSTGTNNSEFGASL